MTEHERLPEDPFHYYLGLGTGRTFQAVAEHFQVTKRTVSRWAKSEDWKGKLRAARGSADGRAAAALEAQQMRDLAKTGALRGAITELMTPARVRAVIASLFRAAVEDKDIQAARILLDRLFGRPRAEPLPGIALDLPDGLQTASDVRVVANALLQGVAAGSLSPEDAGKTAVVLEAARKSVETEDLERRITELEENAKRERGR